MSIKTMAITLIGVDCATQPKRVGLARGTYGGGKAKVEEVTIGSTHDSIVDTILDWVAHSPSALIALDAPLGWPASLGEELFGHVAGQPLQVKPNQLFRRSTDKAIKREIGKQPLDVGADRIARTAYAALALLEEIREKTGETIPLAWGPLPSTGIYAIEVYPAATLMAYDLDVPGYKRKEGREARGMLLNTLRKLIDLPSDISLLKSKDDALDAALCVLAGTDFLRGEALPPTDIDNARKEGWIWVRKPAV